MGKQVKFVWFNFCNRFRESLHESARTHFFSALERSRCGGTCGPRCADPGGMRHAGQSQPAGAGAATQPAHAARHGAAVDLRPRHSASAPERSPAAGTLRAHHRAAPGAGRCGPGRKRARCAAVRAPSAHA